MIYTRRKNSGKSPLGGFNSQEFTFDSGSQVFIYHSFGSEEWLGKATIYLPEFKKEYAYPVAETEVLFAATRKSLMGVLKRKVAEIKDPRLEEIRERMSGEQRIDDSMDWLGSFK